ncbi:hypothetical protein GGR57DRAFT_467469 [Xylariaceae sp. FL1272]|nr:hypothetical protein GGR57DRAFT_467469 [Xylariaceae sp. FL1272]
MTHGRRWPKVSWRRCTEALPLSLLGPMAMALTSTDALTKSTPNKALGRPIDDRNHVATEGTTKMRQANDKGAAHHSVPEDRRYLEELERLVSCVVKTVDFPDRLIPVCSDNQAGST